MEPSTNYNLKPFTRLSGFIALLVISFLIKDSVSIYAAPTEIWHPIVTIAAFGSVYGLIERSQHQRPFGEKPIFYVVYNDLRITSFSTIGIISLVYSVLYGAIMGISILGISLSVSNRIVVLGLGGPSYTFAILLFSLLFLLLLVPIRIVLESYVFLFKVAQKYLNGNKD